MARNFLKMQASCLLVKGLCIFGLRIPSTAMIDPIYSLDLYYHDQPASFVIKTMEEIHQRQGGIADPPHRHNYYTVIWSVGARGSHTIDFREYPIEPGLLFFVSPQQMHQVRTLSEPEPTGFVILFTSDFLVRNSIEESFISNLKLFRDAGETPPLALSEEMHQRLMYYVKEMNDVFLAESAFRMERIGALLKLFLIDCNGHCSLDTTDNTQTIEVGRSITRNFKSLVEKHYHEWHQVKDYADSLNITPSYLNEVIRTSIGHTAKDYIQDRLIVEAKRQYLFTGKSVKEVGFVLGFEDPSHFSKFFKTNTGLSLQEFKDSVATG